MSAQGTYDAVVVGGGPAGSAVALFLAQYGHSVLVLDRATFPRPKLCGEYLSPEVSRILDGLGVLKAVDEAGAVPLRGMRIIAPDGSVLVGRYPTEGRWRGYRDYALALPRLIFDQILFERVKGSPVEVRERHRVTDLLVVGDQVKGVLVQNLSGGRIEVRARVVIGADGRNSVVARALGLVRPHPLERFALMAYVEGVDGLGDHGEIYVDPPDYAILNPIAPGQVNLSLVVPLQHATPHRGRLESFLWARLRQLRHLWPRLQGMRLASPVKALGPLAYRVAQPGVGGVLVVGDAGGFYDPFTGEGIFAAMRSAELAAEVVHQALVPADCSAPALAPFFRRRHEIFAEKEKVAHLLQIVISRRWLANFVAHRLAHRPELLGLLMGVIGDFVPPRALLPPRVLFDRPPPAGTA